MVAEAPRAPEFRAVLERVLADAERRGAPYVDARSGNLHRQVGMYPGPDHRMPSCCAVMEEAMQPGDSIVRTPPKGRGANLIIRYQLPR